MCKLIKPRNFWFVEFMVYVAHTGIATEYTKVLKGGGGRWNKGLDGLVIRLESSLWLVGEGLN